LENNVIPKLTFDSRVKGSEEERERERERMKGKVDAK
jgi:hypothetical protein